GHRRALDPAAGPVALPAPAPPLAPGAPAGEAPVDAAPTAGPAPPANVGGAASDGAGFPERKPPFVAATSPAPPLPPGTNSQTSSAMTVSAAILALSLSAVGARRAQKRNSWDGLSSVRGRRLGGRSEERRVGEGG